MYKCTFTLYRNASVALGGLTHTRTHTRAIFCISWITKILISMTMALGAVGDLLPASSVYPPNIRRERGGLQKWKQWFESCRAGVKRVRTGTFWNWSLSKTGSLIYTVLECYSFWLSLVLDKKLGRIFMRISDTCVQLGRDQTNNTDKEIGPQWQL